MKQNYQKMLKQAQKMQADMAKVQEDLANEELEASAGGGMVKVRVGGDLAVRSVSIDPEAVDPDDVEMLEDMVVAATNEALKNAQDLASQRMGQVTNGLNLPGMPF